MSSAKILDNFVVCNQEDESGDVVKFCGIDPSRRWLVSAPKNENKAPTTGQIAQEMEANFGRCARSHRHRQKSFPRFSRLHGN